MKTNQSLAQFSPLHLMQAPTCYVCGCCKRSLPAEAFYINKKTGHPGNYCKECRRAASHRQRGIEKSSLVARCDAEYPVITRTEDPVLRKTMILHALQTVAASIERKRQKLREDDAECLDY